MARQGSLCTVSYSKTSYSPANTMTPEEIMRRHMAKLVAAPSAEDDDKVVAIADVKQARTGDIRATEASDEEMRADLAKKMKLTPADLKNRLDKIVCLAELQGFANRRQFFPLLPIWSESERAAIITRKLELKKNRCSKCVLAECKGVRNTVSDYDTSS